MNITRELDLAIKLAEVNTTEDGYIIGDKKIDTYMTNSEWKEFKSSMLPSALKEYEAGKEDMLSEKNGCTPEMSSYGSSGRSGSSGAGGVSGVVGTMMRVLRWPNLLKIPPNSLSVK